MGWAKRGRVSLALCQALETLLAAPRSADQHGYLHYIEAALLDAVEAAYRPPLKRTQLAQDRRASGR